MLSLRPLMAADLPRLEPWFNDTETRHWLGDRRWPANKLGMGGPSHHALLALVDDIPAALADVDISDDRRAAFAIVVAPEQRRRGVGNAVTSALLKLPEFSDVSEWFAGVETGNVASRQLLESCGFVRMTDEGAEGFSYFSRRMIGWPRLPWQPSWSAPPEQSRRGISKVAWSRSSAF